MKLVVISGVSGSGKSTALHALEDLQFYCIDNLPVGLLPAFAIKMRALPEGMGQQAAVGIDARNPASDLHRFPEILDRLKEEGVSVEIIYLDADDDILLKRFSETRRKHPLSDEKHSLQDAIHQERALLGPIAERADLYSDTTRSNVHQLRELIRERVNAKDTDVLSILVQSFGFKHGVPADVDFVFDARCLPNPHWETHLRNLTGKDKLVADYLRSHEMVERFLTQISDFLTNWIPCFKENNRSYLTIAIGCTGGQHRSVFLAEELGKILKKQFSSVIVRHRDLP
jgi:UPF0042 nucleotide-binding protein